MASAWPGPLAEKPTVVPVAASSARRAWRSLSASTGLSAVTEWTWYRSSRSPSSSAVSAYWRSKVASEWSLTSCSSASTRQSPV